MTTEEIEMLEWCLKRLKYHKTKKRCIKEIEIKLEKLRKNGEVK